MESMMNKDHSSLVHYCVLATCGCGHDGRLGIGDPLHPQGILSTPNLTLLPFFLQMQSSTALEASDKVRSVHCGGYHTIAWTQKGVLYGWGLNEDGQLGMWSQEDGHRGKNSYATPTRITFFDILYQSFIEERTKCAKSCPELCSSSSSLESSAESVEEDRAGFLLDVSCGAHHSMVLTRCGLYVCGKNTFGQLGLGTEKDAVFDWTPCASLFWPGHHLFNRFVIRGHETASSSEDISEWFGDLDEFRPHGQVGGSSVFLLQGELTHISCGTHHSLLAFRNAIMMDNRDVSNESKKKSMRWYPMLVLATGKGDFGELGYNGDAFSVLLAREKRQASSLLQDAKHSTMQGRVHPTDQQDGRCSTGGAASSSTLCNNSSSTWVENSHYSTSLDEESGSTASTGTGMFSSGWWRKQRRKERRPEFYSLHFLPVLFEPVNHWVEVPQDLLPRTAGRKAYFTSEEMCKMMKKTNAHPEYEKGSGSLSFLELEKSVQWKITSLNAMHLHSSLTLESHSIDAKTETVSRQQQVWHWGCYCCNEVEGLESSIPVREVWDQEDKPIIDSSSVSNNFSLHAGNEVLYRYRHPSGAVCGQGVLLSKGSGSLVGVGDEDAFEAQWTKISDPQWCGITEMHGRDHLLFVVEKENAADLVTEKRSSTSSCSLRSFRSTEVWGMGSNLHGQLGHGDSDLFASPIPVVRPGDEVVLPSSAIVAHPAIEKGEDDESSCLWKVAQIRNVAAGVNHSMFLMDIFKDNSKERKKARDIFCYGFPANERGKFSRFTIAQKLSSYPRFSDGRSGWDTVRCCAHKRLAREKCFRLPLFCSVSFALQTSPFQLSDNNCTLQSGVRYFSTTLSQKNVLASSPTRKFSDAIPSEHSSTKRDVSQSSGHPNLLDSLFLDELKDCVDAFPPNEWISLSDLYARLSPTVKKEYIRPYKTLLVVLQQVALPLEITLHDDGVFWCRGVPPLSGGKQGEEEGSSEEVVHSVLETVSACASLSPKGASAGVAHTPSGVEESGHHSISSAQFSAASPTPKNPFSPQVLSGDDGYADERTFQVDFYFDVGLTKIPPPPHDFDVTPSSLGHIQPKEDGSVISIKSFVTHIPYFFVPLTEILEKMPGYTEQHIEKYFKSPAVEMIQLSGQRYMRLFGGYGKISLEGCEVSEKLFIQYKPNLALASSFVKAFDGVTDKWMPLETLLTRTDPAIVDQLPFKGSAAIIYFAQMQHIFAFAVDAKNGGAVLLRPPGFGGLESNTTPTPKTTNFVVRFLPLEGTCDIAQVEASIPPALKDEMQEYYGSLENFLEAHRPLFYVEHSVVMLTNYKRRLHVATLPLEEQLSIALQKRDKGKIRSLRRRIAFRENPSHAFHDPDNLAREIARYLPRKGFVSLKQFMRRSIPEELLFYMPRKTHNFFCNYPQQFTQFEFQQPGAWCICRPEEPLPKGVIRQNFSDGDIIRLVAQYLQQKGPKSCAQIIVNLPRGAHDAVKKKHGGMYYFVTKHPKYFNVIIGSETQNATGSAVVHLLAVPGSELSDATSLSGSFSASSEVEETGEYPEELDDGDD